MKNKKNDLVSVIIPTFSRPYNLERAIKSTLSQTYKNIEIIIVDDNGIGSKYQIETEKAIRNYIKKGEVKYIKHDINKNGATARNTGLKASKGIYVNFLDDDDEFLPDKIKNQVNLLEKNIKYAACCCDSIIQYHHHQDIVKCQQNGNLIEAILSGNAHFNTSSVLFRRNALEELNGFDESFRRHQDWELYIRFFRKYLMISTFQMPLLIKHVTTTSVITNEPLKQIEYLEFFLNKYKMDFETYQKKNAIYQYLYLNLANSLVYYGKYRIGLEYLKKAYSFQNPKIKNLIENVVVFLKSFIRKLL